MGKNVEPHIEINGDVKDFLTQLIPAVPVTRNNEWLSYIGELKIKGRTRPTDGFTLKNIIEMVRRDFRDETIIATDVGQHQMWVTQYFRFRKPRTFLSSGGLGAMGYGLGAAIGGCIANNKQKTVLFTGDGSFGMNLTELATAVSQELPIVIIILNNNTLGLPRQWQYAFYEERYAYTTLNRKTDFIAVAKAFGAEGYSAKTLQQLEKALQNLPDNKPTVIDCPIGIDEKVLPMIPPGGSIKDIITW
jgi:acetolactate synthase-1/2/3 large subunit